ncbi:hypothetical protein JT06_09610 [Desulfobulbus sp. Tol-SR]|nr:hypothetical protein JT06_09610 [Desulfobulbus sp. Tol-SR]
MRADTDALDQRPFCLEHRLYQAGVSGPGKITDQPGIIALEGKDFGRVSSDKLDPDSLLLIIVPVEGNRGNRRRCLG